jgi:hydroxymethylpyrimidine/phosphomethylpyrimidine kinase
MRIALTIAGSDSGGGAGIQADLKTFHQFGVFGTSAVVAVTAQNTRGVRDIHPIPVRTVEAQLAAVVEDLPPDAVKSGMLATAGLVEAVAGAVQRHELTNYVLDPVMVASSGDRLLEPAAERVLAERLLPLATVVTPNLDEARILAEMDIRTVDDMERAAGALLARGARAALVKGGHLASGDEVIDVLAYGDEVHRIPHRRVQTTSTHGTGCTLSAAIAAGLALGRELHTAVTDALAFVHEAIVRAPGLGGGHGPLNHFVSAPRAEAGRR